MGIKLHSSASVFVHDLVMIPIAWMGAFWLRFDLGLIPDRFFSAAVGNLPIVVLVQACVFWFFSLYRGVWHFTSTRDLIRIIKAVLTGVFLITIFLFLYNRLEGIPRSVIPVYVCLLIPLLSSTRFLSRFWRDSLQTTISGKRTLVIGAGSAGEMLVRDLLRDNQSTYSPVIFLDDDQSKIKREIHGIRVGGAISELPNFIGQMNVEMLLIAIPSAKDSEMRSIVETCELSGIPFQTLPSVKEVLSGSVSSETLRDVSIEDLLGRQPVRLDWTMINETLKGKSILVTGGGGSIGSELCKQIAGIGPGKLIVFDQSEFNLYQIDAELSRLNPDSNHHAILGDVTDRFSVNRLIRLYKPDIIFHVSAYKHVPLLENQVREAVFNNVIGTKIVAEEALRSGVKRFVLISTDKAVNPTNVMGATKRAAEILCQNLNDPDGTHFITVRFGNVLDSAGSVVPLFRNQIREGGPVTVTHPDITRYFMTIPEACQLIMQAEAAGQGGEVFVLDMGEPIKISYLAEQMIRLSGKKPGKDGIPIEYIGLRPGEKLYEELFHSQEQLMETGYDKLFLAQSRKYDAASWSILVEELTRACQQDDHQKTLEILQQLVPEYSPTEQ